MTKLPSLSSKEVIKAIRSAGFENAPKKENKGQALYA
jgi:predicted RNA binding protein YcfA (HicA-like mRNA interferase family)